MTLLEDNSPSAYTLTAQKLDKYLTPAGQSGIKFLKNVIFFNPAKLIVFPELDLSWVPGLDSVPEHELHKYRNHLGPRAVKNHPTTSIDLDIFWKSCKELLPTLSNLALRYMYATVNSADTEMSFSLYNLILRGLNEESLQSLLFLYYIKFVVRLF